MAINLKIIKREALRFDIDLKLKIDKHDNAMFGGNFKIFRKILVGNQRHWENVARGHLSSRLGTVSRLYMYKKYDSKENRKYVKSKIKNIMFDFMSREMDSIEGRTFSTDFRRLYIG